LVKKSISVYVIKMPTYYVSSVNPVAAALVESGEFVGQVTALPDTNSATRALTISTSAAQSFFKFYTDATYNGAGVINTSVIGVGGVSGSFAFATPDNLRSSEFIALLAREVFGSSEAADLFSNQAAIHTSWNIAAGTTALASLNARTSSQGAIASKELVDAMFLTSNNTDERFTLAYGAAVGTGAPGTGKHYAVSGGSGSGASVDVTMTGSTINNISVHTAFFAFDDIANRVTSDNHGYSNGNTITFTSITTTTGINTTDAYYVIAKTDNTFQLSNSEGGAAIPLANDGSGTISGVGSGFVKGDSIVITQSTGNTIIITLNSVQAAMLNGTLDNASGIEVPLQTGDVLRVLFTIQSASSQQDVSNDVIPVLNQKFLVDYTLV
jgi:hypothetical protein